MKTTLKIRGMHCRSCELLIEDHLSEIPEISKIIANYKRKEIDVYHNQPLPFDKIEEAIKKAGYSIGEEQKKTWFTRDWSIYEELITAGMLATVFYLILNKFGLFDLSLSSEAPAILVGIVAGFSTCMALIGGLTLGLSARFAEKHPESTTSQKFKPHLFFNLGRIASYTILGGAIGLIGKALQPSPTFLATLTIAVAIIMLTMGIQLTEISPKFSNFKLTLPSSIAKAFGITKRHEKEYSHKNAFVLGALTFFLPCGFTQAMQIYAISTGSFTGGAAAMGLFALGTLPGLLGVGFLSSVFKGQAGKIFFKLAGIVVIVFALINLQNGLSVFGINKSLTVNNSTANDTVEDQVNLPVTNPAQTPDKPETSEQSQDVAVEEGVQVIRMTQKFNGYFPNVFTIKKGIPVKWIITSETTYSCASAVIMPDMNIGTYLQEGENIIEFTPQETGELDFMCSMGMFRGQFNVID